MDLANIFVKLASFVIKFVHFAKCILYLEFYYQQKHAVLFAVFLL